MLLNQHTASTAKSSHYRNSDVATLRSELLTYCISLVKSPSIAEDLTQDTMLKAMPVVMGSTHHPNVRAYLFRVARHVWIDWIRRKSVEQKYLFEDSVRDLTHFYDTMVDQTDIEWGVEQLVRHLTPLQRTIFLLRDVFVYSTSEVGSILGMTETAVKSALKRARKRLENVRVHLDDEWSKEDSEFQRDLVRAYVVAIYDGDVETVLHYTQLDTVDPMMAMSRAMALVSRRPRHEPSGIHHAPSHTDSLLCAA